MPSDVRARDAAFTLREATPEDIPELEQLIAASARGLGSGDYTPQQIESALGDALGVDTQLVRDATYFVALADGAIVGCGGWSWRRTLFGADAVSGREPDALDPAREAARIRAFFVHPGWARRGIGRALLLRCEAQARARGFRSAELMATLTGVRLYRAFGYAAGKPIEHTLRDGVRIPFVPMHRSLA